MIALYITSPSSLHAFEPARTNGLRTGLIPARTEPMLLSMAAGFTLLDSKSAVFAFHELYSRT